MKINPTPLKNPLPGSTGGNGRTQGVSSLVSPAPSGAKRMVDLSSAALQLSNLNTGDSDVNLDRVNQIRSAIASGDLKIDTSRIADGLIASARELLK